VLADINTQSGVAKLLQLLCLKWTIQIKLP